MNKKLTPLEAFEKIKGLAWLNTEDSDETEECINIVDKSLKALEVIKNKKVNVYMLFWYFKYKPTYKKYTEAFKELTNEYSDEEMLTQEEYNLLKEILL